MVLLGCWALYQAVYAESILGKMLYAYTIYSAALTPVVLAAFYSRRVTAWGAVAAIATGTVVTLAWDNPGVKRLLLPPMLAQRDAIFPALAVAAIVVMIVVSLCHAAALRRRNSSAICRDRVSGDGTGSQKCLASGFRRFTLSVNSL